MGGVEHGSRFPWRAFDPDYEPHFLINITSGSPNYSVNNVVYKVLERFGYVDKLKEMREERRCILRAGKMNDTASLDMAS